jgi:peroxiredoxin
MQDLSNKRQGVRSQDSGARIENRRKNSLLFDSGSWILASVLFILASDSWLPISALAAEIPSPYAIESLTGQKAPDFALKDIAGKLVTLSSHKGKVVILVFWATWCPPCKDELQSLNKLYQTYKSRGLVILAVSSDRSLSSVKDFIAQNPVTFDILFDDKLSVSRDLYKAFMVPTTFVIDQRGVIFKKHFGEQDWTRSELVKELDSLL